MLPVFLFYHKSRCITTAFISGLYIFFVRVLGLHSYIEGGECYAKNIEKYNIEVGNRIKQQRLAQNLTREQLAQLSGYSANFIQEIERGAPGLSSESMRAFAIALKVSSDSLLFGGVSESFEFLFDKLNAVPQEKRKYVIKVIEAAIDCAVSQDGPDVL